MIKYIVYFLILFTLSASCKGQEICDKYLVGSQHESFCLGDTIKSCGAIYIPLNLDGDLKVVEFYSNGMILAEKYYSGIRLSDTIEAIDPETYEVVKRKISFFKRDTPIKVWIFYFLDGSVWKKINFTQ